MSLIEKIRAKEARLSVIGLGYVGLPLLVEFARAGFKVVGVDVDDRKVKSVNEGVSYIKDVPSKDLREAIDRGVLSATTVFGVLADADTVNICVPTPLRKTRDPDISFIVSAVDEIRKYLHGQMLIILESRLAPVSPLRLSASLKYRRNCLSRTP